MTPQQVAQLRADLEDGPRRNRLQAPPKVEALTSAPRSVPWFCRWPLGLVHLFVALTWLILRPFIAAGARRPSLVRGLVSLSAWLLWWFWVGLAAVASAPIALLAFVYGLWEIQFHAATKRAEHRLRSHGWAPAPRNVAKPAPTGDDRIDMANMRRHLAAVHGVTFKPRWRTRALHVAQTVVLVVVLLPLALTFTYELGANTADTTVFGDAIAAVLP
ncbi:MAG: hypothetical protein AAF467_27330 [Actinomycetota bacterium]